MAVFINEEELAFLKIGSPKVKVGIFEFTVAWKKLSDLQNVIETPTYVYLLNTVQCWNQAYSIQKQPEACNFIKKETLTLVFSCEFSEISKNTFFTEHLWTNASVSRLGARQLFLGNVNCHSRCTYDVQITLI